jgi:hypothetical protein
MIPWKPLAKLPDRWIRMHSLSFSIVSGAMSKLQE